MKLLSILSLAGLASAAAVYTKRDDIDASGEVVLPDLSPSSELALDQWTTVTSAGIEDGTNVTVFRFPDSQLYALEFAQGPSVDVKVGQDGKCIGCKDEEGTSITQRDVDHLGVEGLEKRFFLIHLIGDLIKVKLAFIGGIKKAIFAGCFADYRRPIWIHRPGGHGGSCEVGPHGYIHWEHVHIGCSNGIGGYYVGCSAQGTQLWKWRDGRVCPIHVRRGRRITKCSSCSRGGRWW